MRTTDTLTISLPPGMSEQIARVQKAEHRTRSELLREAWRRYFESRFPEEQPTKADLAAIKRGRRALKKGELVTLNQLHHELDAARHETRQKRTRRPA